MTDIFNFEDWDNQFDSEGLKNDLDQVKNNDSTSDEVPHDVYEVKIEKLELALSKTSGKPMVSCWFKILSNKCKGRLIFMNQVINNGFGLHKANEFLRSLSEIPVTFESFAQYNRLLTDIKGEIDGKFEYQLNYSKDAKGYNTFKIEKVFDAAPF
ncbi:MAG: DUF669 domain-containing protein [Alphaproteobacteria bacterium]|nr:DUF669 domain-containing protein [Alphaproteobacteria bacterium]